MTRIDVIFIHYCRVKSIQELAAEAEAQAEFEIAELFDDIGGAASDDDELEVVAPEASAEEE